MPSVLYKKENIEPKSNFWLDVELIFVYYLSEVVGATLAPPRGCATDFSQWIQILYTMQSLYISIYYLYTDTTIAWDYYSNVYLLLLYYVLLLLLLF